MIIGLSNVYCIANPPIIADRVTKNVHGGYNYYNKNKLIYKSQKNVFNSQNIYSSKGLEYRGQKTKTGEQFKKMKK